MAQLTAQIKLMNFIQDGINVDGIDFVWMKHGETYKLTTNTQEADPFKTLESICAGRDGKVCELTYQAYVQLIQDIKPQ